MAAAARSVRFPEARWLVYPMLITCGLKLAIEDLTDHVHQLLGHEEHRR
jgi:hypothetical protein